MRSQRGFTVVELLIAMAIAGVLLAITIPEIYNARIRAQAGLLAGDAKTLHTAFKQYYLDNGSYPGSAQLDSFEPLRGGGYYTGNIARMLAGGSADAFDAPDDGGTDQEFWVEMTLEVDPTVRFVVADSNDSPLGAGAWLDGVFRFDNGSLTRM